jgi:thioredoxin reductase
MGEELGSTRDYEVVIVGGGPAGLSAALWLARYRRRVLLVDEGVPRNQSTWAVHGYPGLSDLPPAEVRRRMLQQTLAAGAEHREASVTGLAGRKDDFLLELSAGPAVRSRRVLLAYGQRDVLPQIEGVADLFGSSVFHCPDCDGPSLAGARVAVLGHDHGAASLALYLLTWTPHMVLLTNGQPPELPAAALATLATRNVEIRSERVLRLVPRGRFLHRVDVEHGEAINVEGLFFHLGTLPGSDLAARLGCEHDAAGHIRVDRTQESSVPGVYAAGDVTGQPYLVISAAAEGVRAALALHRSLLPPDFDLPGTEEPDGS